MSYYRSNFYGSNYYSTNYYVGTGGGPITPTSDNYFDRLGELGFTGSLSVRQFDYLTNQGVSGATSKRKFEHLRNLGYTGRTVSEMLKQKTEAEGFITVGEMMYKTGLIPA